MKKLKPLSTKKPPVPSDSHSDIEDWMQNIMPALHPIVKVLDELICSSITDLQFSINWKKAYYGTLDLGWIIELVAYDVSVNVVFLGGQSFDNPPPLGDASRYIKIKTLEEAQSPEMSSWVRQAGHVPGWK